MLRALCLSDTGIGCLQSAGSRTSALRRRSTADVTNMTSSSSSSSSSTRRPPCFSLSSLSSPYPSVLSSPSLVSQRVLVGTVKVQRCCCDHTHTHTHTRAVGLGAPLTWRFGVCVRTPTTEHAPADHTCCLSVRPLRSSRVCQHATYEPDTTE